MRDLSRRPLAFRWIVRCSRIRLRGSSKGAGRFELQLQDLLLPAAKTSKLLEEIWLVRSE